MAMKRFTIQTPDRTFQVLIRERGRGLGKRWIATTRSIRETSPVGVRDAYNKMADTIDRWYPRRR